VYAGVLRQDCARVMSGFFARKRD
jgi:hypothetical protein